VRFIAITKTNACLSRQLTCFTVLWGVSSGSDSDSDSESVIITAAVVVDAYAGVGGDSDSSDGAEIGPVADASGARVNNDDAHEGNDDEDEDEDEDDEDDDDKSAGSKVPSPSSLLRALLLLRDAAAGTRIRFGSYGGARLGTAWAISSVFRFSPSCCLHLAQRRGPSLSEVRPPLRPAA
jgi:hypothetical protein